MGRVRIASVIATLALAAAFAGCGGSSGTPLSTGNSAPPANTGAPGTAPPAPTGILKHYNPHIDPAQFTDVVTNKWFPMHRGLVMTYVGTRDGNPTRHVFTVTHETKQVLGVNCLVIRDVVTQNGSLIEKTTDWYARTRRATSGTSARRRPSTRTASSRTPRAPGRRRRQGASRASSWRRTRRPGDGYRQEYRPGVALDKARS